MPKMVDKNKVKAVGSGIVIKNTIKNTISDTTKNPHPEWLFGLNPGAIEAQEEDGQRELA